MSTATDERDGSSWIVLPRWSYPFLPLPSPCLNFTRSRSISAQSCLLSSSSNASFCNEVSRSTFKMDAIEHTPQHTYLVVRQHPTTVFDNHLKIVFTKGFLCIAFRCFDRDLFTFLGIHGGNASETIVWISLLWLFGLVGHIREDFKLSQLTMSTASRRNRTQHHPASNTLFFLCLYPTTLLTTICRLAFQRDYFVLFSVVLIGIYLHSWAYMVAMQVRPFFGSIFFGCFDVLDQNATLILSISLPSSRPAVTTTWSLIHINAILPLLTSILWLCGQRIEFYFSQWPQ